MKKTTAAIISQERIGEGIYSLWLGAEEIAEAAAPGQFVSLYCHDHSRLLPRPISICEIDREKGAIRLVYRVAGKGTAEFSGLSAGGSIEVLGPLGNGFPLERGGEEKKLLLIGGGIGVPPIVELAKQIQGKKQIVAGYRDALFLDQELRAAGKLYVATEDGSIGTKGTVLDAIREQNLEADVIFACGPTPMLRALKEYALEKGIECWISMEERMACGVGACLGCVCKSAETDDHSHVKNKRICKDGPVFLATEVEV
ncbi:MAG TPA: dihydroorotate dehydrogenase electron transfer subunit [Candidatus Limivivens intestinipullorum]|uniref:Dihydroorotate dehydrogenase B (NAD(+)), electron transfer subunit n=1 Tax=Candidatus Limivivens intestinipullorum TaxID=2840858 RepID=A0A9D1ET94_9FIRM|nr:dihydroorotate dehydrogenase electron transfer subunit [Candidatus Limivivens intestinipullorum]